MEGYHWASVGSPNETPIVTSLIYPIGVPSSPLDIPLPWPSCCVVSSLQFFHYSVREGPGGGWQGRSGVVAEEGFCPWMSECG